MDGKKKKWIFVTGGVCSSLGKGITAASIGVLLKNAGYQVNMLKIDPYLNVDAGTMGPYQHGEVYVTKDGAETDLDLGNYERYVNIEMSKLNNITTGQIYLSVIDAERKGEYLGETVQVIPHITNEIKRRILLADDSKNSDIVIVELGGTVGDIESTPFVEAIRQFAIDEGRENVKFLHLTLVPIIKGSAELKTKPTQHSVKELMALGIQPDFLFCRSEVMLPDELRKKMALFCNIDESCIFTAVEVKKSIYEVPINFQKQGVDRVIQEKLGLSYREPNLEKWNAIVDISVNSAETVTIAMVGKYIKLEDTYKSIDAALKHGGIGNRVKVEIKKIDADKILSGKEVIGDNIDAILIPGGFGDRGIEGKIKTIQHARMHRIPILGICLGLQCMVIEYSRNVCKIKDANSREFNPTSDAAVIELLANLKNVAYMGGTMRKGAMKSILKPGTMAHRIYGKTEIEERHRHRYEVNPEYVETLQKNGLVIGGKAESGLVETVELAEHPWFFGVQYHPEFNSSPLFPHPIFVSFIGAALENRRSRMEKKG
jgi:CTP synthase